MPHLLSLISCCLCLTFSVIFIVDNYFIYSLFFYLLSAFLFNLCERFRPQLYFWWALFPKPKIAFILWPVYLVWGIWAMNKFMLNNPKRFSVSQIGDNKEPEYFATWNETLSFTTREILKNGKIACIVDMGKFNWRKKFWGGDEWAFLTYIIEPTGKIIYM